jgi:hypothetical protein
LILRRIERPSVRENESPVERIVRKIGQGQFGSRYITHSDAVDLGTLDRALLPDYDLHRDRVLAVLRGDSIEVVGDPVCALESDHDGKTADDSEFSNGDLLGQNF